MYCNKCGHMNDEGTNFCLNCGNKLEHISENNQPEKRFCINCGSEVVNDTKYCINCGVDLTTGKKPKNKKFGTIVISIILIVAIVCSAVYGCVVTSNPFMRLQSAANHTLNAKSATMEISTYDGYDALDISGEIELNAKKEYLRLHLMVQGEGEAWIRYEDSDLESCYREIGEDIEPEDEIEEMRETLDFLFDALNGDYDNSSAMDYMKRNGMDEYLRLDNLEKEGNKLVKKLASKENLEKIFGYKKMKNGSEKIYSFDVDIYELLVFIIDNGRDLFTTEGYYEFVDIKDELKYEDFQRCRVRLTTKGKYLTGYSIEADGFNMDIKLSDFGKTSVDYPTLYH